MAVEFVGCADDLDEARGQREGAGRRHGRDLDDGEFVAAPPGYDVLGADATAHALGCDLQQLVADGMPERVIDALEMIEVEAQHRDAFATPQVTQHRCGQFIERHPVRQAGEHVVIRQVPDFFLGED